MARWVALLRGINVGGGNRLPMAELRATAEALGFSDVTTYIQSGNLVVDAPGDASERSIAECLRRAIEQRHHLSVPVVVRSATELGGTVDRHPDAGSAIDPKLMHVAFFDRVPARDAVGRVDVSGWEPDRWRLDGREVFLTYPGGSARSPLTIDVFERAWNVAGTARNLNTVRRLAELAHRSG